MTGAVLSGGMSRRMGFNKAFITIDGVTIIERTLGVFKSVFADVFIVANDIPLYERLSTPVFADIISGGGSLGGIYTALFHSKTENVFVAACDMPFLDPLAIKKVVATGGVYDVVLPFTGGMLHPLHAMYSRRCTPVMEEMIKGGNLKITDFLDKVRVKRLTIEDFGAIQIERSVENVNTKDELIKVEGKIDINI